MLEVKLGGEQVLLLHQKAIWWPAQKTLIVADLHWGKTAHFRKHGIAVPLHTQNSDEEKLSLLIEAHGADKLIIAGDMFHSRANNEVQNFAQWRAKHPGLDIDLVIGNHDILAKEQYLLNSITLHPVCLDAGPFMVSHDKMQDAQKFHIHGHIHPCVSIESRGRNKNPRLPCFCSNKECMVLPSFGRFTGTHKVSLSEYDNVYVIADEEVIQWK